MSTAFGTNLLRRVGTALVALPLLLAALFLGPSLLFVGIAAAAAALGLWEFFGLVGRANLTPFRVPGFLLASVFFFEVAGAGQTGMPLWPAAALVFLSSLLWRGDDFPQSVAAAAVSLLGAVYLGALGGTIAGLRLLAPASVGPWRVSLLFAIIMGSDTVAFFTGHALGRHRLAPAVSPGKTVEGALGGILGGVAGALLVRQGGLSLPAVDAALLGAAVSLAGMVGDLVESLFKRWVGVKDSGQLLPGHGGMLDRVDSLLFGAPVLYYYFLGTR